MTTTQHRMEERYEFDTGLPGDETCAAMRDFVKERTPQWSHWRIKLLSHAAYCTRWIDDYMDLGDQEFETADEAIAAKIAAAHKRWESYR